jgi:Arc/MetJ-type ribon-helix-helix transcriptional regulator
MALTLSPATEQRIQRETARGPYTAPDDLLNHALDLLEAESKGDWLSQNRDDIRQRLAESIASRDRGESYSPEEAKAILAQRRVSRAALDLKTLQL